jgi:drug/metabolite transporter (DMT)-like permease
VLLKRSANLPHKSFIYEYLNWRVILAYFIFVLVLLLNTYAFTQVPMRYGSVIDAFTYVFVLVFSWLFLKEKITKEKLIGNVIIIIGFLIYTL